MTSNDITRNDNDYIEVKVIIKNQTGESFDSGKLIIKNINKTFIISNLNSTIFLPKKRI